MVDPPAFAPVVIELAPAPAPAAATRVVLGRDLSAELAAQVEASAADSACVLVVSDARVATSAWFATVRAAVEEGDRPLVLVRVAGNEAGKNLEQVADLWEAWLAAGAGRDAVVVAVGGGSVTDVAGFAAACFLRGVPWIAVPTTVLGMADAAIGGKTGVNTRRGKNLAGAVHHPRAVIADLEALASLPDAAYQDGWAEVVKAAVLGDAGLLRDLERHAHAVARREPAVVRDLLAAAIRVKAAVVAADDRDAGGREALNFGHTLAHALERATAPALSHGRAVAAGLVAESRLAVRLGRLPGDVPERLIDVLAGLGLDWRPPPVARAALLEALAVDKKRRGGQLRVALPDALGRSGATPCVEVDPSDLIALLPGPG